MEFQEDPGEQKTKNVTPLGKWKPKVRGKLRIEKVRHEQGEHSVTETKARGMSRSG